MYHSEPQWRRVENAEFDLSMFPSLAQQRKMHCSLNVTIIILVLVIILVVGNIMREDVTGEKEKKEEKGKEEQPEERSVQRKDPSEGGETKYSGRIS